MFRNLIFIFCLIGVAGVARADETQDLNTVLQNARPPSEGAVETKKVQKLGFKKMDKIVEINGQAVDNPQKAMELYNSMKPTDQATVERAASPTCVPNIARETGGQVAGFRCFGLSIEDPLSRAGVMNNDIIMSIDGEAISTPEQLSQATSRVESQQFSKILIVRDGHEEILHRNVE